MNYNLDDYTIYESLITSTDSNNVFNTKPIGIILHNNHIILKLYSNKTLVNIIQNTKFTVQFTLNPLLYTKAVFNKFKEEDYTKNEQFIELTEITDTIHAKLINYKCTNDITIITAELLTKNITNNFPLINRATNKILDLLVKYTRICLMNFEEKQKYIKEVEDSTNFIKKVGNSTHIESLNIIKKELNII